MGERENPIRRLKQLVNAWPDGDVGHIDCLWQLGMPRDGTVTAYGCCGKVFLLVEYGQGGWELFIPASEENSIGATLAAVTKYLTGWEPPRTDL